MSESILAYTDESGNTGNNLIVDTLLDSGINQAVSPVHYGNRFFRLSLAHVIVENLSQRSQEEFWSVYERGDVEGFRRVLRRLRWNIQNKVKDRRVQELLLDAMDWALDHTEEFPELKFRRSELDAPNAVAFSLLVGGIHTLLEGTGLQVTRFIHDEQSQFARAMEEMYGVHTRFSFSTSPFSWMTDMQEVDTYRCPIEVTSKLLVGLQIIDVVLWLVRRCTEGSLGRWNCCAALADWVTENGVLSEFSRGQLATEVARAALTLSLLPISPADEARGKHIVEEMEERRRRRMMDQEGRA
ncbi:MAG: hypothetical protein ACE5JD_00125 [Candidatus Methylomirabilia bacterium]